MTRNKFWYLPFRLSAKHAPVVNLGGGANSADPISRQFPFLAIASPLSPLAQEFAMTLNLSLFNVTSSQLTKKDQL